MKFIASRPSFKAFRMCGAYPLLPTIVYSREVVCRAITIAWLCFGVEMECDLPMGLIGQLKAKEFKDTDDSMTWPGLNEYIEAMFKEKGK